jgi:hypothetical protein
MFFRTKKNTGVSSGFGNKFLFRAIMKSSSLKFLSAVFILTGICGAIEFLWNNQVAENMRMKNGFLLLGIFAASVTAIHLFLLQSSKGDGQQFVRKYLAATVFKFMFYIFLVLVFLLFSTDNKTALVLHFLFYYAVFTVLEVSMLYSELSKLKSKK